MARFRARESTIAPAGYNRFLIPPAALAVHLSIGQVYAFSTFNLPMARLLGIDKSLPDDWSFVALGWIFSIGIVFLGLSAAVFGRWVERVGPRMAMFTAALCFSGGFMVSAVGVAIHQLWLVYLGYGVLGGCGLGIGYISPVSTLIKWFPDRPGMATGMAIMGFGGGALIASPLSVALMDYFKSASDTGVLATFVTMGLIYLAFMMLGAYFVKVPPAGWVPTGYVAPTQSSAMITRANVEVNEALKTPQFYFLWGVLCMNVSAGIGVLGQASPMIQEMFPGRVTPIAAAGFVGLLSLFNMGGRFVWSSVSDTIGRKNTYRIFFALGIVLYALVPTTGRIGSVSLFIAGFGVILSMYGGGFATIPAYLRDMFGTMQVGAIHGRLLTAWSTAGVLGPGLVNYLRQYWIDSGYPKSEAYSITMYILAGLLLIGFISNHLVIAVDEKHHFRGKIDQ